MVTQITTQLRAIAAAPDFFQESERLVGRWVGAGVGAEAVDDVLAFMEQHPDIDFGAPGPLAHFIERFYGSDYKTALLASLVRKPTQHTVWLLNRVINGEREPDTRSVCLAQMQQIADDRSVEDDARAC